jgi:hypothetical protein
LSTILQHQLASKLLGSDFSAEYKPGAMNVVADALSRYHGDETGEVMATSVPTFEIFDDLHRVIDSDLELLKLKQDVVASDHGDDGVVVDDLSSCQGVCLCRAPRHHSRRRSLAPTTPAMKVHIKCFIAPTLIFRCQVCDFVRACAVCQRNKTEQLQPASLL